MPFAEQEYIRAAFPGITVNRRTRFTRARVSPGMIRAVITFDLHDNDRPGDIARCIDFLGEHQLRATFFLPTSLLTDRTLTASFRLLQTSGHELGTHGHEHDATEMNALGGTNTSALGFLRRSTEEFAGFFGYRPVVFRSPAWSVVGEAALDQLNELGYKVDCSATPQRLGILSSKPWSNPYLFARRSPGFVRSNLVQVPTTSFLVPLGTPTFHTFRTSLSILMTRAAAFEARLFPSRVVVAQFHVRDLVAEGTLSGWSKKELRHLLPSRHGIVARYWIRMTDTRAIATLSERVIAELARGSVVSLESIHQHLQHHGRATVSAETAMESESLSG